MLSSGVGLEDVVVGWVRVMSRRRLAVGVVEVVGRSSRLEDDQRGEPESKETKEEEVKVVVLGLQGARKEEKKSEREDEREINLNKGD